MAALGHGPLTNSQFREVTGMNRKQVVRLLKNLEQEGIVRKDGVKRGSRWILLGKGGGMVCYNIAAMALIIYQREGTAGPYQEGAGCYFMSVI